MTETVHHLRETIHWKEAQKLGGNPWVYKPRGMMLAPGGLKIIRKFQAQGRSAKHRDETQFFDVIYDEDYVTEWLLHNVVGCFPGITHVQMRELFTKALKRRKQIEDEEKQSASQTV